MDLLIIIGNEEYINYSYTIDLIREVNEKNKFMEKKLGKIIMAKICIDLIKNFKQTGNLKNEYIEEIINFEEENKKIISDNLKLFENLCLEKNLEDFLNKNIDEIYADIIKSLIKNKKFDNLDIIINTMKEMDMENIFITQTIYNELSDILSKDEFVEDYKINNKKDIYNENKINFYYILLKYVTKSSFYIYNLNFLLETRKLIINLLKANEVINKGKNISCNDKITYVIKKLVDSDYYFKKLELFFESKKDDIIIIEDILDNNKKFENILLKDYKEAKEMHKKLPIIKFIFEENCKDDKNKKNEKEIKKAVETWKKLEKMISQQKIKRMKDDERQIICKYFLDEKNKNILVDNFGQKVYDNFLININKFYKSNKVIEPKIKKEEKENEKYIKPSHDEKNLNNKTTNKSKEKDEKNEQNRNYSLSSNNTEEESSTTFESKNNTNLQAAKPRLRLKKNGPKMNISDIADYILLKCHISLHTNKKGNDPYIIFDEILYGEHYLEINYSKLMQYKDDLYSYETKDISHKNLKRFFEYLDDIEKGINEEFKNEYCLKINLRLLKEMEFGSKNKDKIHNITAYYTFFEPIKNKCFEFKEENVLINKTNSKAQGFQFLLYNINSNRYKNIKYSEEFLNKNEINFSNNEKEKLNYFKTDSFHERQASEYAIIEYIKTLGKTRYSVDFIKELSNGYFIIGSQNFLIIYDHQFLEKSSLTIKCKDWVYSVCERVLIKEKNKEKKNIEIICCMNSGIGLLELTEKKSNLTVIETQLKQNKKKKPKVDKTKNTYNICFEMNEDNYIMAGIRGIVYYHNFFGNKNEIEQDKITNESFKAGIKLNENIVALTSNSVIPEGNDKLVFYNVNKKKLTERISGYSFITSEHGLALMKNKILLCACKKYIKDQKNGILLINAQLGENKEIKTPFYDMGNFEVYCLCPIMKVINNNENYDVEMADQTYKKNIEIIDTEYFLVGGYNDEKREGVVKLYKIILTGNVEDTKIKFLQNIEIIGNRKFDDFGIQIKSIIQSRITGNIIITCADGKIHLFTKPNLDFYIKKQNPMAVKEQK